MTTADIYNLAYSCLIDGTGYHEPITLEEAAYTLQCWKDEGIDYDGLAPEAFMLAWNDVLEELSPVVAKTNEDAYSGGNEKPSSQPSEFRKRKR